MEYVPCGHVPDTAVRVEPAQKLPSGHILHELESVEASNVPAKQAEGDTEDVGQKYPAGHSPDTALNPAISQKLPLSQAEQD